MAAARSAKRETTNAIADVATVRLMVEEIGGLLGLLQVSQPTLRSRFNEKSV
jgi:hypothetical protein